MTRQFPLHFLVLLLCSPGLLVAQENQLASYDDETAYEVYSYVLSLRDGSSESRATNFIIRKETLRNFGAFTDTEPDRSICLRPDPESEKIIGPAISDYLRVNKTKWRLKDDLKLTIAYQLVPSDEILSLIQKDGWGAFHKRYPESGSFIDLSAVGFNADKSVAIVSKGSWCGDLCGRGEYYVLQKKDGKWIPLDWKGDKCSWIS